MTRRDKLHHRASEQIFRGILSIIAALTFSIWLYGDMTTLLREVVMGLGLTTIALSQMKGWVENRIESIMHWRRTHTDVD